MRRLDILVQGGVDYLLLAQRLKKVENHWPRQMFSEIDKMIFGCLFYKSNKKQSAAFGFICNIVLCKMW